MNCIDVPAQMPLSLIHSLHAKYLLQNLNIRLVLFFFFNFWRFNCRIRSVGRAFSLSKNVVKLVCSTFHVSSVLQHTCFTFSVLGWERCQKEMWGVCPTTCLFQNPHPILQFGVFFCNAYLDSYNNKESGKKSIPQSVAKEPGGCCIYRNSEEL